jgi:ABC-type lipoprotein export system ATPase subunit
MLDEDNTGRIVDLLIESTRRAGAALLIVTHNPTVARAADRLMMIRGGQLLVADGGTLHAEMQPS